jgi:murein DD-endopeptidase MepM/ murein hydrolase activator NlpD
MQNRFTLALQQVSAQQDELISAMTVQNEQEITLFALQRKLNGVTAERNVAQADLDGLQAEFAASAEGNGPRQSTEHELKITVNALNSVLDETLQTRDASIEYSEILELEIEETAQLIKLDAQRRDRMITQLEEAVLISFGPLERMFKRTGLDVDSLLANVRRNYSGSGGLNEALDEANFVGMDAPDLRLEALMRDLDTVQIYNIAAAKLPLAMPVRTTFRYSSNFGPRNGKLHKGIDMAGPVGSPLYATADGVVKFAGWQTGFGNVVKITHEFGFETVYAHQSKILVKAGQRVSRGERIGDMGNTGRSSGSHLHYEVRNSGTAVNPIDFIKAGQNVF